MKNNQFIHLITVLLLSAFVGNLTHAVEKSIYNEQILNQNIIYQKDDKGNILNERVPSDEYGNAQGNQFDLAQDGVFKGYTIAVLHLCIERCRSKKFDFKQPETALVEKGFSIVRWANNPPNPEILEDTLKKASQLWIISDRTRKLNHEHLRIVKAFFNSGKGVYIWGDNKPYYADANYIAKSLFGTTMSGNTPGDKTVGLQTSDRKKGLLRNHLITTGLEYIYEGITIATIQPNNNLKPLIYGSAGNLVAAIYDKDGKRAILDGGFTRLCHKWDTAGTGRYVKNAAAWLVNYERFGKKGTDNTLSSRSIVIDGLSFKGPCLVAALLAEIGYFNTDMKNIDAKDVVDALRAFQKDIHVSPTGLLDEQTWTKLSAIKLSTRRKSRIKELRCNGK